MDYLKGPTNIQKFKRDCDTYVKGNMMIPRKDFYYCLKANGVHEQDVALVADSFADRATGDVDMRLVNRKLGFDQNMS